MYVANGGNDVAFFGILFQQYSPTLLGSTVNNIIVSTAVCTLEYAFVVN